MEQTQRAPKLKRPFTPAIRAIAITAYLDESISLCEHARRTGLSESYISAIGIEEKLKKRTRGRFKPGAKAKRKHTSSDYRGLARRGLYWASRKAAEEVHGGKMANGMSWYDASLAVVRMMAGAAC